MKYSRGRSIYPEVYIIVSLICMVGAISTLAYLPSEGAPDKASVLSDHSRSIDRPALAEEPAQSSAGQGELLFVKDGKRLLLPLRHTSAIGSISGFGARVTVTQTFVNEIDKTIEALYVFPLPENAAVDSMIMTIGDRRIRGNIKIREEARKIFEEARRQGKTAALLEQERPNIFTQSVANIQPGDTILITISYVQRIEYRDGEFNFVFPMVVGPRYIPGAPKSGINDRGTEPQTDQVPDAPAITPAIVPEGMRSGNDIDVKVFVDAGAPVTVIGSPSHKINIATMPDGRCTVTLRLEDRIPNKDFILQYAIAEKAIKPVLMTHWDETGMGYFQLIVLPPASAAQSEIFPRELVFVVDNSGSMGGEPIEKCKEVMRLCLSHMRSDDVFRVIKFSGSTEVMSEQPLSATSRAVENALRFVDNMQGGGGTEMMRAVDAIFDPPELPGRIRLVLFMTDGMVGNDREIIAAIRKRSGTSRVFSLGVGSSPNRFLLEGMAYAGRGACTYIRQDGDAAKAADHFHQCIDGPVLSDITIEWRSITAVEQQPARIPDLFRDMPLVITGKYFNPGRGTVVIRGKRAGGREYVEVVPVDLGLSPENACVKTLWARSRITELEVLGAGICGDLDVKSDSARKEITELGLTYRIMTSYTSFVAVDDAKRGKDGQWVRIEQPVEMPEGVSYASQPPNRYGSGVMGLMTGRRGCAGIGYGSGSTSGFGGYSGSIDALLQGAGGLSGASTSNLRCESVKFVQGGSILTGGRSMAGIRRVVMQNLASLRYEYAKRLRTNPNFKGKVTVKFSIDENGAVIACTITESTTNDPEFEAAIVAKIQRWAFGKSERPGDTTEVVYPFVFAS